MANIEDTEQKFEDCPACVNFRRRNKIKICNSCDFGEYFEEKFSTLNPDIDFKKGFFDNEWEKE